MPKSKTRKKAQKGRKTGVTDESHIDETRRSARGYSSLSALEKAIPGDAQLLAARLSVLTSQRHVAINQGASLLGGANWAGLALLPIADLALTACGAQWPITKNIPYGANWPTHIRSGLDQFVEIQRLIAGGMTYAALITTRLFLERWTINVASSHSLEPATNEIESEYINRVWKVFGKTVPFNMGDEWAWLSECLHGRGSYQVVLRSDLFTNGKNFADTATKQFFERISHIAHAVLRQVHAAIDTSLRTRNLGHLLSPLRIQYNLPPNDIIKAFTSTDIFISQFRPLDPAFAFSPHAGRLADMGRLYRKTLATAAIKGEQMEVTFYEVQKAFLERRGRSVETAVNAMTSEAAFNDPRSGREYLLARLFRYQAIGQGAILVAGLSSTNEAHAMRTAAAALESAWNLWLDDTDVSLGCVRGILEQTARARVHRLKPEKAVRFEAVRNRPNRWLEAASLNRLNEFGRALGEFSHIKTTSRREVARKRLTAAQEDFAPYPEQTARLHALDTSAYFLAKEVHSRLVVHYPNLSDAFLETVTLMDADGHRAFEDDTLARALAIRDSDWGRPDFHFF